MNKAKLVSQVAAETSTPQAAAERMVGAVFTAIADALARDEPVAIAGFGRFAPEAAPRVRDAILEPGSRSPCRRRRCRGSSRRRPCATPSTASVGDVSGREETERISSIHQTCEHVRRLRADIGCPRCHRSS